MLCVLAVAAHVGFVYAGITTTGHIATVAHAEKSGQEDTKTRNVKATIATTASGGSVLQCQEDTTLALLVIGRSRDGGHSDTKACVDARLEPPPTTHTGSCMCIQGMPARSSSSTDAGTTPTGHIATVAHAEQSGQGDTKTRNAMATATTASGGSVLQCQEDTILALMVIGRSRDGGHSDTKACVDAPHLLPPLHRAKSAWEMASGQEGTGMRTVSWTRNETIASGATVHGSEDTTVCINACMLSMIKS